MIDIVADTRVGDGVKIRTRVIAATTQACVRVYLVTGFAAENWNMTN